MINTYRCIRYSEHTLLTFQATSDSVDDLEKILRFRPRKSGNERLYEQGFYAYLRGKWREVKEKQALDYFANNYTPPEISLLLFESISSLPDDRPGYEWSALIEEAIRNFFATKGYMVTRGQLGYEVFRKVPYEITPGLRVYDGVTYRVHVTQTFVARLQIDIAYGCQIDDQGQLVDYKRIQDRFSGQPEVMGLLKSHTIRDTESIFELACKFVQSIPVLTNAGNCSFETQPLQTQRLDCEVWFWPHEAPLEIEVASGNIVDLPQHMQEHGFHFYTHPSSIVVMIVHPATEARKWGSFSNWQVIKGLVCKSLNYMIDSEIPVCSLEYSIDEHNADKICQKASEILLEYPNLTPLFLAIIPPQNSRYSEDVELRAIESFTFGLVKKLRRLRRGAYLVPLNWDKLLDDYNRLYIVESSVLKGLVILGAKPWRILGIALNENELIDELAFIGIDLNIYKRVPVVGGVILNAFGELLGYQLVQIKPDGDRVGISDIALLIRRLIDRHYDVTGKYPKHTIIHRDGIFSSVIEDVIDAINYHDVEYDFVEIRKHGAPRIRQLKNTAGTPSKDIAVGNEREGYSYLVNTLSLLERVSSYQTVFPAPESLAVRKIFGNTPMKTLSAQVYALSRAYYGAYHRTERLPVTILYADALVNNASLKEGQKEFGKAITVDSIAYWL